MWLIKFNSEEYDDHMIAWRDWKHDNIPVHSGTQSPAQAMIEHHQQQVLLHTTASNAKTMNLYVGGNEKKHLKASIPITEDHDTVKAIDYAMKWS
jgi:hypothetical protein